MTIGTISVAAAGAACANSLRGDFVEACNNFKKAASVMAYMHSQHLPQWVALGSSTSEADLPAECVRNVAVGFEKVFLAHAQQMAVAKALQASSDKINMALMAKLTKGVAETLDAFVSQLRANAGMHFCRLPGPYLSYITFQGMLQDAVSVYFQARKEWAGGENRGIAVAMMGQCRKSLEVRDTVTSKGIPEAINSSSSPLHVLKPTLDEFKKHVDGIIASWLKDVNTVYFEKVPAAVPVSSLLNKGMLMMKVEPWSGGDTSDVVPVTLALKDENAGGGGGGGGGGGTESVRGIIEQTEMAGRAGATAPSAPPAEMKRSDSDLAREMQEMWNKEG
jgi:hypothetical protein